MAKGTSRAEVMSNFLVYLFINFLKNNIIMIIMQAGLCKLPCL